MNILQSIIYWLAFLPRMLIEINNEICNDLEIPDWSALAAILGSIAGIIGYKKFKKRK